MIAQILLNVLLHVAVIETRLVFLKFLYLFILDQTLPIITRYWRLGAGDYVFDFRFFGVKETALTTELKKV